MGYLVPHLLTDAKDHRRKEWEESQLKYNGITGQQGVSGSAGMSGIQGICGQQGVVGYQGIQGIQGESGYSHVGKTVFKNDIHVDGMPVGQFIRNIPVESIEKSVVKILEKYGLMANAIRFDADPTIGYHDATLGYPYNPRMKEDDEEMSLDEINDAIDEEDKEYDKPKTFTLDEIINIIDSTDTRLNVNVKGIWENTKEQLIDKDKLIEKFKRL